MGTAFSSLCLVKRLTNNIHSSAEAVIALRQRLNETVDQFEALRNEHAALEVKFEAITHELTIAKSDRTLPHPLFCPYEIDIWIQ